MIVITKAVGRTVMGRKTTCSGCGFVLETVASYREDRKLWQENHTKKFATHARKTPKMSDPCVRLLVDRKDK